MKNYFSSFRHTYNVAELQRYVDKFNYREQFRSIWVRHERIIQFFYLFFYLFFQHNKYKPTFEIADATLSNISS